MKVIIITGEPFPNGMAAVSRIKCYARAIKQGGLPCEVLIYRRTERYGVTPKNIENSGEFDGVPYRYISKTPLRASNPVIRRLYDKIDVYRTERYLKRNMSTGDVLFFYMGGNVNLMLRFMKVAQSKGAFCVRDLCELPYGTAAETERAIRLRKETIKKQFPKLNGIISISDTLLNMARTYTSPTCKHIKVPILVDYNQYYLTDYSKDIDIPYVFHAGTLYEQKDGILGMIEAFGKASIKLQDPVYFISTGTLDNSPHKEEIKNLIDKYHLDNRLLFTGYLAEEKLKDYLRKASLVIINKYRTQQNNYCFSTKLGEYMAVGKPVIITNVGEAMNWVKDGESAYIVEPEDNDALAGAIVKVFDNLEESKRIGLAGQKVCRESFDFRVWSKPLVDFLNNLGK